VADPRRPSRTRFTVETSRKRSRVASGRKSGNKRSDEIWIGLSTIGAAALATFLALYLTSRPFDPMNASIAPQQVVPAGPIISPSPSPKSSSSVTPSPTPVPEVSPSTPGGETASEPPDDATIRSHVEAAMAADAVVSKLDVSTVVENGKVTIVGSVKSAELKQRIEKIVRGVKGVNSIDDQLIITEATP
jgi:hypothetical protein